MTPAELRAEIEELERQQRAMETSLRNIEKYFAEQGWDPPLPLPKKG